MDFMRKGKRSWIALATITAGLVVSSVFLAAEYARVSTLQRENSILSSEINDYNIQTGFFLNATGQTSMNLTQSFSSHLAKLESLNPGEALTDYAFNATLSLSGNSMGVGPATGVQSFIGMNEIEKPLGDLFGGTSNLGAASTISAENWQFAIKSLQTTYLSNGSASISANLAFSGQSRLFGSFNGTISSKYFYVRENGAWLILDENWNFTSVKEQYPINSM